MSPLRFIFLSAFFAGLVISSDAYTSNFFKERDGQFKGVEDGYFFYKDPAELPPEEDKLDDTKKKIPFSEGDFDGTIDWKRVKDMHPTELRILLDDVKNFAIQNPTEERLLAYMTLQTMAMEKATAFQETWAEVLQQNPILNENAKRPAAAFVTNMLVVERRDELAKAVDHMREEMGLVFFYSNDCTYCDKQKEILQDFGTRREWANIVGVNISDDPDVGKEFNVQIVPDLWIVGNVDGEIKKRRLSAGLSSHTQIERGILNAYSRWFKGDKNYLPKAFKPLIELDEFIDSMPLSIDSKNTQTDDPSTEQ